MSPRSVIFEKSRTLLVLLLCLIVILSAHVELRFVDSDSYRMHTDGLTDCLYSTEPQQGNVLFHISS